MITDNDDVQSDAEVLDFGRSAIQPVLGKLRHEHGLDALEIMLCTISETHDGAVQSGEEPLSRLLKACIAYIVHRIDGASVEDAKREILRLAGVVPDQNAPSTERLQ